MEDNNIIDISFIIPIYNTNIEYLEKCIKSIEKQGMNKNKYEILLINDGSSNAEIEKFCEKYCKLNESARYIYQNNSGVSTARNTGITNSKGKYIMFIDSDDELDEEFIQKFMILENKKFDIAILDYKLIYSTFSKKETMNKYMDLSDKKQEILSNILYNPFYFENFIMGSIWAKIFSRSFLLENEVFFKEKLRNAEDREFMLRAVDKARYIQYYPIECYCYRFNESSVSHLNSKKAYKYYIRFYNDVKIFFEKTNYNQSIQKYLEYGIINELLPLTIFHKDNKQKMKYIKRNFLHIYFKFNMEQVLQNMKYKDIKSSKGKVKLFLYKHKMIGCLRMFFLYKQSKNAKILFR